MNRDTQGRPKTAQRQAPHKHKKMRQIALAHFMTVYARKAKSLCAKLFSKI
jgi:hypothetical protein